MGGTLLVGVDVAKRVSHVCLVEQHGGVIGRPFLLRNTKESLGAFCKRLEKESSARGLRPVIRLEATGVYSWPATSVLRARGYEVQVFHPTQLKSAREDGIRKTKNDKVDAHTLATTSKQPPQTDYSDTTRIQIRELGRYREKLFAVMEAQWKRLMRNVFVKFPNLDDEYRLDTLWMRAFLKEYASPEQVVEAGEDDVARIIREANGQPAFAKAKATEIVAFCKECLTTDFVGDVLGLVNRQILRRIEQIEHDVEEVEAEMLRLWEGVRPRFAYPELEGMDEVTAAIIYGELGDPLQYATEDKIVAAAGLDPVSYQSGASRTRVGRISKQGPPVLRKVLSRRILGMRRTNPTIRAYYEKKRGEGKPYKVVLTACAKRLVRLVHNAEVKRAKAAASQK